jgi:hypothetical protein
MRPIAFSTLLLALFLATTSARAAADETPQAPAADTPPDDEWGKAKPGYVQLLASAMVGDGFRFNNPYRLASPLGDTAESVSRTATYGDLGIAATFFGNPLGFRHGLSARWSFALEGVSQSVITPSYLLYRRWRSLAAHGRLGVPIVVSPETTWGLEAALGGTFFVRGGIGVTAEVVGDLFYGAGTRDVKSVTYPVLSAQAGLVFAYEVLP